MKRPHGKITWKEQPTVAVSTHLPRLVPVPETSKRLETEWQDHFHIGSLWRIRNPLDTRKDIKTGIPYLKRDLYDTYPGHAILIPTGSLAIYAGTERMDEMGKDGPLRLLRHTFIVGCGRYIITDFANIEPI